ncbi:MAG: 2-oxoglutarate dehydrogenase complex dihydrolipoyllysine-residue succinyltransferase [Bdellovibrionales bacterium]|nr:2-oxoglutarate dehydrogenase complex dihydrolipoyllysine-residue succinyltransferase [Bdellovibrionales bacterium]
MKKDIKVPSVGESVNEADIEKWEKQTGDIVLKGEVIALLETDKASLEVPAEQDGKLTILKPAGETVSIGEVIGYLEPISAEEKAAAAIPSKEQTSTDPTQTETTQNPVKTESSSPEKPSPSQNEGSLSPAVRHLIGEHHLDPQSLSGTGKGGRLTKEDILKALQSPSKDSQLSPPDSTIPPSSAPPIPSDFLEKSKQLLKSSDLKSPSSQPHFQENQYREPMSRMRKKTAERLLFSQQSTATLSTFNEVDMSKIINLRKKYQELFIKKHGIKLGFMSFFVKAAVAALKEYPQINAFIEGTDIVYNKSCHIGIAVSTDKGLVVPVIHGAEQLSFSEIEDQIIQYSEKAKERKLTPEDLSGGTFTISNGGIFGSLLSTPILNPPQSGILGMHKIEPRPVAIDGQVAIRPMMYLTLSYDHRIVDGRESVGFLVKVKEYVEDPARILIET